MSLRASDQRRPTRSSSFDYGDAEQATRPESTAPIELRNFLKKHESLKAQLRRSENIDITEVCKYIPKETELPLNCTIYLA